MAPHDLLCKWCSTFVGQKKNFCSIFCESRYTRSKRRKLPFKKPASFSEQSRSAEYDYPRTSKSSPRRKEQFLEEVITAMDAEMGDRDRIRRNRYQYRDDDDAGTCLFCRRPLYVSNVQFCDRACETRKRQLSWKSMHIDVPKARRDKFVWLNTEQPVNPPPNYMHYVPSWAIYGK